MIIRKFQYHDTGYWFLLFTGLAAAGFYTTYFARILEPMPLVIHLHFVLMVLWMGMLIAQPLFIKYKKRSWHQLTGKASYVVAPLLLITAFLLTRNEYYRNISRLEEAVANGSQLYTHHDILRLAAASPIALVYFIWFLVFYILAIRHRRNFNKHARYMVATALTLTGPTVDRIIGINLGMETIAGVSSFFISFLLIDLVLGRLLYLDVKNKRDTRALKISLMVYLSGQLFYYLCPYIDGWPSVMQVLMLPQP